MTERDLPFGGAISAFFRDGAPADLRRAVERAGKDDILAPSWPWDGEMSRKAYEAELEPLQIELVKLQASVKARGQRVAILFEGRDAAGKGGTIRAFTEHLNPRGARVVALPRPSDVEAGQWYFQRYIAQLPAAGELVFFDRSWYNRAIVEHVFGFCTAEQREHFFAQVGGFEEMLVEDGIRLFKLWLDTGRAEQLRRFLDREKDPLKQWKLSRIDVDGLAKWAEYSAAIAETFARTHLPHAPWTVVRTEDQRRGRLGAIRHLLAALSYDGRDPGLAVPPDPRLVGGPEIVPPENR